MKYFAALALALLAITPAFAQDGAAQAVFQRSGQTTRTISGALRAPGTDRYAFTARRGQHVAIALRTSDPAIQWKLVDTRGRQIYSSVSTMDLRLETAMPGDGLYTVVIYQMGNPGDGARSTPYTLRVDAQGGALVSSSRAADPLGPAPPRSFLFACQNSAPITAVFYSTNPATVDLTRNGRTLRATQAIAASGARYVGANGLQFWNKGRDAQVDWPGERGLSCTTK